MQLYLQAAQQTVKKYRSLTIGADKHATSSSKHSKSSHVSYMHDVSIRKYLTWCITAEPIDCKKEKCSGCRRMDCGSCKNCTDMKKFGGQGKLKQKCIHRVCTAKLTQENGM